MFSNSIALAHPQTSRTQGSEFVFVTGYPMSKRPFYPHPNLDRPIASNGFDLRGAGRTMQRAP